MILKSPTSVPLILYAAPSPESPSLDVTVVTAVFPSATLTDAVDPPEFDVITGLLSFTSVTVMVNVCVSVLLLDVAVTVNSYMLFPPLSAGIS